MAENISEFKKAVETAHTKVFGKESKPVLPPVTSMWRDINVFNEVGIPSLTYGPTRSLPEEQDKDKGKFMYKKDLVDVSKIYALAALDICKVMDAS